MNRSRGAVMVESAIVLSAFLTILLGAIQFGVIGFLQLTVDAGSFLNAHQNVIGTINPSVADATHQVFPQIQVGEISPTIAPAPAPTVYVDYGYNNPDPAVQAASANDRHGGASMLQPYLQQSTILKKPFTTLGQSLDVQSTATEPKWFESAPHWDVSNQQYGGSSTLTNYRANPYVDGTNTPPYYISAAYVVHCNAVQVNWTACPNPYPDFLALGLGNNLDVFNWSNPQPGVSGPGDSTGPDGTTGTFQTMACHQRYYAQLAQFFETNPSLNAQESTYYVAYYNYWFGVTNFKNWAAYPNDTSPAGKAKTAIRTIYSWDVEHGSNPPLNFQFGRNPLFPTVGC